MAAWQLWCTSGPSRGSTILACHCFLLLLGRPVGACQSSFAPALGLRQTSLSGLCLCCFRDHALPLESGPPRLPRILPLASTRSQARPLLRIFQRSPVSLALVPPNRQRRIDGDRRRWCSRRRCLLPLESFSLPCLSLSKKKGK